MVDRDNMTVSEGPVFPSTGQPTLLAMSGLRRRLFYFFPALLLIALLFLGGGEFVRGQIGKTTVPRSTKAPVDSADMTPQEVIAQASPAVVSIEVFCHSSGMGGSASGVIFDPRGYIVTNYHVVTGEDEFFVTLFDGSVLSAQPIGVDPSDDLAVLKVTTSKHLHTMPIGDSSQLRVGDEVLVIGNPSVWTPPVNLSQSVTGGFISALGRTPKENGDESIDAIQHSAPVNPGNSGGALVNMQAQLVGIHAEHPRYTDHTPVLGVGFAIPSNRIKFIVLQLIHYKEVRHSGHATIGATTISVGPALVEQDSLSVDHGAYITDVDKHGPAALTGLQAGDVIVQVNNIPINSALSLNDALMLADPGSTVTLGIVRGSQSMQVNVKLAEQKVEGSPSESCSPSGLVAGKG
jgi:S1-C subfamily serine protease